MGFDSCFKLITQALFETHPYLATNKQALHGFNMPDRQHYKKQAQQCEEAVRQIKSDDLHEFLRLVLPFISELCDEHTRIAFYKLDEFCNVSLDNQLHVKNSALFFVINNSEELVTHINSIEATKLLPDLLKYFSGIDDEMKTTRLNKHMAAALKLHFGESLLVRVGGAGVEYDIKIINKSTQQQTSKAPLEHKINGSAMHLKIHTFDVKKSEFRGYINRLFAEIKQKNCSELIIDMRNNDGGLTANADFILTRILTKPYSQIKYSEIYISKISRSYFESFLPKFLVKTGLHKLIPQFGAIFKAPFNNFAHINFKIIKPRGDFSHLKTTLVVNSASISTCSLFTAAFLAYGGGEVQGKCGGLATHYGNQISVPISGTGLFLEVPCSINVGN